MRKQTILLLAGLLGISMLVSAGVLIITKNYKDNRQSKRDAEKELHGTINIEYKNFKTDVEKMADKSIESINKITEITSLYITIESEYKSIVAAIEEYETELRVVEDNYKKLNTLCLGAEYRIYEVNNKCRAYEINLEQIINTFVRNLKAINDKIAEYNDWAKEEENKDHKQLEIIAAKNYKDYIDINKDGEYKSQIGD